MKALITLFILVALLPLQSCQLFEDSKLLNSGVDTLLTEDSGLVDELAQDTTDDDLLFEEAAIEEVKEVEEEESYNSIYGGTSGVNSPKPFHAIVGSFQNIKYAEKYAVKIQSQGYSGKLIMGSNGFHRVSAKSYNSYGEGLADVGNIKADLNTRVWVCRE